MEDALLPSAIVLSLNQYVVARYRLINVLLDCHLNRRTEVCLNRQFHCKLQSSPFVELWLSEANLDKFVGQFHLTNESLKNVELLSLCQQNVI